MGNWKWKDNSTIVAKYTGETKKIAEFFGSNGIINKEIIDEFNSDYYANYKYEVRKPLIKKISFLFILLFILSMLSILVFQNHIVVIANIVEILFIYIFFSSVRNIKFPNEQFSKLQIGILSTLSIGIIVFNYLNLENIVPNLFLIFELVEASDVSFDLINMIKINLIGVSIISIILTIVWSFVGKKRLSSVLAPLITLGGQTILLFLLDTLIKTEDTLIKILTDDSVGILLILLSVILSIAYEIIFLFISKKVAGYQPRERLNFKYR